MAVQNTAVTTRGRAHLGCSSKSPYVKYCVFNNTCILSSPASWQKHATSELFTSGERHRFHGLLGSYDIFEWSWLIFNHTIMLSCISEISWLTACSSQCTSCTLNSNLNQVCSSCQSITTLSSIDATCFRKCQKLILKFNMNCDYETLREP